MKKICRRVLPATAYGTHLPLGCFSPTDRQRGLLMESEKQKEGQSFEKVKEKVINWK